MARPNTIDPIRSANWRSLVDDYVAMTNPSTLSSTLHVTGDITGTITSSATGPIISTLSPDKDDTYDLGESTLEFKDAFIDGIAYIDKIEAGIASDIDQTPLIIRTGDTETLIVAPHVSAASAYQPSIKSNTGLYFHAEGGIGFFGVNGWNILTMRCPSSVLGIIEPMIDNRGDLGSASKKWNNLFINTIASTIMFTDRKTGISILDSGSTIDTGLGTVPTKVLVAPMNTLCLTSWNTIDSTGSIILLHNAGITATLSWYAEI